MLGVFLAAAFLSVRTRDIRRLAMIVAMTVLVGGVLISQNAMLKGLAANPVGLGPHTGGSTFHQRVDIWRRTAALIRDHRFAGVGLGNFAHVYEPIYNPRLNEDLRRGVHAHNLWLHQTAELGIPGGAAYLALWLAGWTGDISPYGGAGITAFNVNLGNGTHARTLVNVAPQIAQRDLRWGILEWNPSVPSSTSPTVYQAEMAIIEQYRPSLLVPYLWGDSYYKVDNSPFETALKELVARALWCMWNLARECLSTRRFPVRRSDLRF